jgi:hypothetical protein
MVQLPSLLIVEMVISSSLARSVVKCEGWVGGSLFHTTTTGLRCTASLGRMGKPTGKLN